MNLPGTLDLGEKLPAEQNAPTATQQDEDPLWSRRKLFTAGALATVLLATKENASAQSSGYDPTASWQSAENRLVRRITMGLTEAEVARALKLGYDGYLEYQLNYKAIDDSKVNTYLASKFPTLTLPIGDLAKHDDYVPETQLSEAMIYRSTYSERQLFERMVEFWTDHFSMTIYKVGPRKVWDDLNVIRKNALGKFPDMLRASARSPAMLLYLDQYASTQEHPNQNYARELMELQTLGVKGGYTQNDVKEVARCFTGWTLNWDEHSAQYGKFVFDPYIHDYGAKTVLKTKIPANGGQEDGEKVLDILAKHPSTAKFIAYKMIHWLLRYDPPTDLVTQVAQVYLSTGGDIKAMIRVILKKENLIAAPAKLKRPYHLLVSTLRATSATITAYDDLFWWQSYALGQPPYVWGPPNGYPDSGDFWVGLMLSRWNYVFWLLNKDLKGVSVNVSGLQKLQNANKIADKIDAMLFGSEMPVNDKADLIHFLRPNPPSEKRIRDAVALALNSPNFQWY